MKSICYYCKKPMGSVPGGARGLFVTDMFPCMACEEKMDAGVLLIPIKEGQKIAEDQLMFPDPERAGSPIFVPEEQLLKLHGLVNIEKLIMSRWAFATPKVLAKIKKLLDE